MFSRNDPLRPLAWLLWSSNTSTQLPSWMPTAPSRWALGHRVILWLKTPRCLHFPTRWHPGFYTGHPKPSTICLCLPHFYHHHPASLHPNVSQWSFSISVTVVNGSRLTKLTLTPCFICCWLWVNLSSSAFHLSVYALMSCWNAFLSLLSIYHLAMKPFWAVPVPQW